MSEILYRISLIENSYSFGKTDYDEYVKKTNEYNAKYNNWSTSLQSPEELRETHLQNAWNAIFDKRYKDPKPAYRYINNLKKHYDFIEFFVEQADIEWKRHEQGI
jgi:hypothetical protein